MTIVGFNDLHPSLHADLSLNRHILELITEEIRRPIQNVSEGIYLQPFHCRPALARIAEIEGNLTGVYLLFSDSSLNPPQKMLGVALHD